MTRDEKAALRAKARELRRGSRDEEPPRDEEQAEEREPQRNGRSHVRAEPQQGAPSHDLAEMASNARDLLRSLRGVEAESVSGVTRTRNGWKVTLEVVELRRVPESTDVLASYDVELDGDGGFLSFERGRRYHRSQAETGGGR